MDALNKPKGFSTRPEKAFNTEDTENGHREDQRKQGKQGIQRARIAE